MSEAIRDLKERSDDMSDLERSMTKVKWDMDEVKENLTKVADSLTTISEDNDAMDRKLDDFIKNLYTGLNERDKKTDEKIDRMERHIDAKMDEKLAGLDTRINCNRKEYDECWTQTPWRCARQMGSHSNGLQSSSPRIQI